MPGTFSEYDDGRLALDVLESCVVCGIKAQGTRSLPLNKPQILDADGAPQALL